MKHNIVNKVVRILQKDDNSGLSITEIVKISRLSRCAVRTALAKLEGGGNVFVRKIGMAKVYSLKRGK